MSYYVTREVGIGEGESIAPASCNLFFNYLRSAEFSVSEVQSSEFVIGGTRDKKRIALLQEEPNVRLEADLVGLKPLWWALGGTVPASTISWLTVARDVTPVASGENACLQVWGCKVDSCEITFERGEVASCELNLLGKGAAIMAEAVPSPSINYAIDPVYYSDVNVTVAGSQLPEVGRVVLTVDNNLSRRLSVSTATGYRAYAILEGGLDVTGRLLVGAQALGVLAKVLSRTGGNTVQISINKTHGGTLTATITMPNVWFYEYPERMRGIEPYEVEVSFTALPTLTLPAISVSANTFGL